jgi:ribonuclease VapC
VIVVDTSAIVAILREEPEALSFADAMGEAGGCLISAVGAFEAAMVMIGRGPAAGAAGVDELITELGVEIVPFDEALARASCAAFIRFGKGRHAAGLNFGDCASYALAHSRGLPLLYKGDDFAKTDIVAAV